MAIDATTLDGIYEQSPYAADELIYVDAPIVERFKRIHVSGYNLNHSLHVSGLHGTNYVDQLAVIRPRYSYEPADRNPFRSLSAPPIFSRSLAD